MSQLTSADFIKQRLALKTYEAKKELLEAAVDSENVFRGLFARHRESWEIPEVDDPYVGLVDVYQNLEALRHLPRFEGDTAPRCFKPKDGGLPEGALSVVDSLKEFEQSWDCFTESQLRFLDWSNVFAAGGSVAGCMAPLPAKVTEGSWAEGRTKRRAYFHDEAFPGSDVDLFLYGLNQKQAEQKLVDIFEAVQAANPYPVVCFRSAHAITLVSQYPFRHIQVVLRLYNSPAEVLMGFDVDSCACGYDGKRAYMCQRTVLAFASQENSVDMSRRSPSYEMRLSKYAQRGFQVVVPGLSRQRVDPSLYERRFDKVQGLARLLLLEKLSTPEARYRYRIEQKIKRAARREQYSLRRKMNKVLGDRHELARMEDDFTPADGAAAGAELSNYSTVFLPWGPAWTASKVQRLMTKKDHALNSVQILPGGRVVKNTRKYRVHICASGTMTEVVADPFPQDPPVPADVPEESLEQCVRGPVRWLADNPGRQQIGSFHPITEGDWMEGAYLSAAMEGLPALCAVDDAKGIQDIFTDEAGADQLTQRDFLGRSALHVAAYCNAKKACEVLLARPECTVEVMDARLADGRTAFHIAAMHGFTEVLKQLLEKRKELLAKADGEESEEAAGAIEPLDIDTGDWELKLSPLQYAVLMGNTEALELLLQEGASSKKVAVHKDKNMSRSTIALCAAYVSELQDPAKAEGIVKLLFESGASSAQVDTTSCTIWHELASKPSNAKALEIFLKADPNRAKTLDIVNTAGTTALGVASTAGNVEAVKLLLEYGASAELSVEEYTMRKQRAKDATGDKASRFGGFGFGFNNATMDDQHRAPVWLAVQNKQLDCVRAFLDHQPALANYAARQQGQNNKSQSLLAMVINMQKHLEQANKQEASTKSKNHKDVDSLKQTMSQEEEGSYGHLLLTDQLWRTEFEEVQATMANSQVFGVDDHETREEMQEREANELKELKALLESHGAKVPEKAEEEDSHFRGLFFQQGRATVSTNPKHDYCKFKGTVSYHPLHRIPKGQQEAAHKLFEATFKGDVDGVKAAGAEVPVSTVNAMGTTAMWYAVYYGHLEVAKTLFAMLGEQMQTEKPEEETSDPNDVASQLKRINNLDLASGAGIQSQSGPSPDKMRKQLEAMEQTLVADVGQSTSVTTKVPPHDVLLAPAICRAKKGTKVGDFMIDRLWTPAVSETALEQRKPLIEIGQSVSLTPMQVAVITGNVEMVEALLEMARQCVEQEKEEIEEAVEEDMDTEVAELSESSPAAKIPMEELMHRLMGSQCGSLGRLNILSLAVIRDDEKIFRALAGFLRSSAVACSLQDWYYQVHPVEKYQPGKRVLPTLHVCQDVTLLQVALQANSKTIAGLLLSGELDETLLGWVDAGKKAGVKAKPRSIRRTQQWHNLTFLSSWLIEHVSKEGTSKEELVRRLVGPDARDGQGRTAIFYATPVSLPWLTELGGKGVNLDQLAVPAKFTHYDAEHDGYTALMAAAYARNHKVCAAMLQAGCSVSSRRPKSRWSCLHSVLAGLDEDGESKPETEEAAVKTLEVLLSACSEEEARALLLDTEAEHSPFMLAAKRGVSAAPARFLAERMVALGDAGKVGLCAKDKQLATAMHMAASQKPPRPDFVQGVIDVAKTAGQEVALGPLVENAAGATPLELLMEQVAEVWKEQRPVHHQMYSGRPRKKKSKKGTQEQETAESKQRRCLELLKSEATGQRQVADFKSVGEAAQSATGEAEKQEMYNGRNPVQLGSLGIDFGHVNWPRMQD